MEDVYGVYECHGFALSYKSDHVTSTVSTSPRHSELEQLLDLFDALFQVPTCLAPHRLVDHGIHLLPNTKPVNMRPYRYPHYQKGKMEKLVNDMLSQGIIRFSHRRFSSPILLVKKKDGSCRFCVDYRALNAATVNDKFPIPMVDEMFDELGRAVILDLHAHTFLVEYIRVAEVLIVGYEHVVMNCGSAGNMYLHSPLMFPAIKQLAIKWWDEYGFVIHP
nr:retrovirus-related Pol polyprotein from transposon 17.6 [Tanacetum cinerariifolium]